MSTSAVLLYKSYMSYLPSSLPVYFFGLPDNRVYMIYARFYEISFEDSGLEFVFAIHEDFAYHYDSSRIIAENYGPISLKVFQEMTDRPDPRIKIVRVSRNLDSYNNAREQLNRMALQMFTETTGSVG